MTEREYVETIRKAAEEYIVEHPAFDFSKYHPGDVISITGHSIAKMGQTNAILLTAAIANAATRAGLDWRTWRDEYDDCFRVAFSEPEKGAEPR